MFILIQALNSSNYTGKLCARLGCHSPCHKGWYPVFLRRYHLIWTKHGIQYIPRTMHTVFALLCFVVVIHWLIFPYPSGLLHWHCGNLTIAPVPAKQPWWMWINTSCEFMWLHNHNKAKHNKTVCIFLGIYCTTQWIGHTIYTREM